MTKELEAFRDILGILSAVSGCEIDMDSEHIKIVKQALNRLESIDNANPSEAMKCLEKIIDNLDDYADFEIKQEANEYIATIKQALLKAQESARSEEILQKYYQEGITLDSVRALKQERDNYKKALEIIKKKTVDIWLIQNKKTLKQYNSMVDESRKLTEEEFNLLKEVLE